jgi:hypothetical protein
VDVLLLQLIPPSLNITSWGKKDAIEVYYFDYWWNGIIQECNDEANKYLLYFRDRIQELEIDVSMIRT